MKIRTRLGSPWAMVVVALALRLVVMRFLYTDRLDPAVDLVERVGRHGGWGHLLACLGEWLVALVAEDFA